MMKKWTALLVLLVLLCAAMTALADWTCACGAANDGKFCTECGTAMPADDTWTCACGKENTSKFCASCGRSKDAANTCAVCGYKPEDGGAFKFCPKCGASSDASAAASTTPPPAAEPLRITSIRDNGEGSATINWKGGYPPYTVYARSYSGTMAQVIVADTYDTSVITRHLEPYYGHQVWVVGGGTSQEKLYQSEGKMKSFREWTGNSISVQALTLKVNHGSAETVKWFSRAEIEATKAATDDPYSWMYDYSLDVEFKYRFTDDHYAMLQMYVTTPGGSILWLGTAEDALLPAGEGCVLPDLVQLYNCLSGDKIEKGMYKVSFYDGALYMTSKEFYIDD